MEIVNADFRKLLTQFEGQKTLILADPPYLNSLTDMYKGADWRMRDFLDLISSIRAPFVFFSHEASGILDFIEWSKKTGAKNHEQFQNISVIARQSTSNYSTTYTDFMVVAK